MKSRILFILSTLIIVSVSSCYYDKEELLYSPNNRPCSDSVGVVSYSQKVVPILRQNCYSCHGSTFPSGNIVMGVYTADKTIAQNGKLVGTISHSVGFSPMPTGMSKLTTCQIATIKKWVNEGMLNN